MAFDGVNYLVVWRDTRMGSGPSSNTDIYGSRITTAGVNLDPLGIAISTAPNVQGEPHVVFAASNYFITWVDARDDPFQFYLDVFAARLSPDGLLLDGSPETGGIAVNTLPGAQKTDPRANFDGSDYVIVWTVGAYAGGIRGARVSPDGELRHGPAENQGVVIADPACFACKLVYPNIRSSGRRRSLVTWINNAEVSGTTKDLRGAMIPGRRRRS